MLFTGTMKLSMFSSDCGWEEEMRWDYSVECDDASKIIETIEKEYEYLARNFHDGSGCLYLCTYGIKVIELDGVLTKDGKEIIGEY